MSEDGVDAADGVSVIGGLGAAADHATRGPSVMNVPLVIAAIQTNSA